MDHKKNTQNERQKILLVEGWRGIAHSFCLVNQWQLLSMKGRVGLTLRFEDKPYFFDHWTKSSGLFKPEQEEFISQIPNLNSGESPDATYKIFSPYDFTQPSVPTLVYIAFENRRVISSRLQNYISMSEVVSSDLLSFAVPSNWVRSALLDFGVPSEKIHVIPNGFCPRIFFPYSDLQRKKVREHLNYQDFTFLNVSGMFTSKGIDLLLTAFSNVLQRYPKSKLVLKGTDTVYPAFSNANAIFSGLPSDKANSIRDNIIYYGSDMSFEEMSNLYNAADCYVSPYRAEGFNLPVLEASACGTPVICSQGGPTDDFTLSTCVDRIKTDLKSDHIDGEYIEPSLDHLTDLMLSSIENQEINRLRAKRQHSFVLENFTWNKIASSLLESIF